MTKMFLMFLGLLFIVANADAAISVKSSLPWMKILGSTTDCVIKDADFQKEVSAIKKFDYSDKAGGRVVLDLLTAKGISISTYKTRNPWSKAIAYTYAGNDTIYFNLRNNPRDFKEMINTVMHETTHIVGYGHGSNSPVGKEKSVPYWVGSIAEKYADKCKGSL